MGVTGRITPCNDTIKVEAGRRDSDTTADLEVEDRASAIDELPSDSAGHPAGAVGDSSVAVAGAAVVTSPAAI
jgi:hypothetical protein